MGWGKVQKVILIRLMVRREARRVPCDSGYMAAQAIPNPHSFRPAFTSPLAVKPMAERRTTDHCRLTFATCFVATYVSMMELRRSLTDAALLVYIVT